MFTIYISEVILNIFLWKILSFEMTFDAKLYTEVGWLKRNTVDL